MSARENVLYRDHSISDRSLDERSAIFSGRWTLPWLGFRNRLSAIMGTWLERTRASARLRPFEYMDPNSGETISLSTTREYSVLSIGGRRFYFGRISGKFDGASSPLAAPESRHLHVQ
jgi:hypothetical protein